MREVVLYIAMSLDGFIARENGELDWLPGASGEEDPSGEDCGYEQFFNSIDTVLMGHETYKQILSFGVEYPYSSKQSYVFTRDSSHPDRDENATFIKESPKTLVGRLKATPGKNIWLNGGADLCSSFLKEDLVDELILFVIPTTIGKGIPLLSKASVERRFELVTSQAYDKGLAKGIVKLHYTSK